MEQCVSEELRNLKWPSDFGLASPETLKQAEKSLKIWIKQIEQVRDEKLCIRGDLSFFYTGRGENLQLFAISCISDILNWNHLEITIMY